MESPGSGELSHFGLVVGGDVHVRTAVATVLGQIGFAVIESANEAEALEIAAVRRPDLCVIDVDPSAPLRLSFCETLRTTTGQLELPIVALVREDDPDSIGDVFDAGVTDMVAKPLQHHVLAYRVRHVLRSE